MSDISTAVLDDTGHVVWTHECVNGRVEATLPNTSWTVVQEEPLTVRPSVSCEACGWHGWITGGECWPAHLGYRRPVPDLMANLRASLDRAKAQRGDSEQ